MDQALIHHEFLRRSYICDAIKVSIGEPKDTLIKRGNFQSRVLKDLGLSRTTMLCNLINKCMKEKGFRLVTIKGYQYYMRKLS